MQNPKAVGSHTQLCTGYFELFCSYVKEERLFPICMYLYFTPDISKVSLPLKQVFLQRRTQYSFFHWLLWKQMRRVWFMQHLQWTKKSCGRQSIVGKPRWNTKWKFLVNYKPQDLNWIVPPRSVFPSPVLLSRTNLLAKYSWGLVQGNNSTTWIHTKQTSNRNT